MPGKLNPDAVGDAAEASRSCLPLPPSQREDRPWARGMCPDPVQQMLTRAGWGGWLGAEHTGRWRPGAGGSWEHSEPSTRSPRHFEGALHEQPWTVRAEESPQLNSAFPGPLGAGRRYIIYSYVMMCSYP